MKIALAKRERLMAELNRLNDFIRMAERLVREETDQAARVTSRVEPEAAPAVPAAPTPAEQHRSLSAVLRDVDEQQHVEAAPDTARRTGLWRAAQAVGTKG